MQIGENQRVELCSSRAVAKLNRIAALKMAVVGPNFHPSQRQIAEIKS